MRLFTGCSFHAAGSAVALAGLLISSFAASFRENTRPYPPDTLIQHHRDLNHNFSQSETRETRETRLSESYGRLPLSFESNAGQANPRVRFLTRGNGYRAFLTPDETVIEFRNSEGRSPGKNRLTRSAVLRIHLLNANRLPRIEGFEPLLNTSNYLIGNNPGAWRAGIVNYAKVRYHNVYPGVDQIYYGDRGNLEHDFVIAPYASPQDIRLGFKGARRITINARGDLILTTAVGDACQHEPLAYQEVDGVKIPVSVQYVLRRGKKVGFKIGKYDRSKALIIDPILEYSTYLGGAGFEQAYGIAVDSSGDAYITGITKSANFPTENGFQASYM